MCSGTSQSNQVQCGNGAAVNLHSEISCEHCGHHGADDNRCNSCDCHIDPSDENRCLAGPSAEVCCGAGQYALAGQETCADCGAGTYNNLPGQSGCIGCVAGKYGEDFGSSDCTICAAGKYADVEGSTACTDCLGGKYLATASAAVEDPRSTMSPLQVCSVQGLMTKRRSRVFSE